MTQSEGVAAQVPPGLASPEGPEPHSGLRPTGGIPNAEILSWILALSPWIFAFAIVASQ